MRFKKLEIQNFLIIHYCSLDLDSQGLVRVAGVNQDSGDTFSSNASGKSSLFEAILWCLWGKTNKGLQADEVIRNGADGHTEVSVYWEDKGTEYKVTRYRKHRSFGNEVKFFISNIDSTQNSIAETQKIIDQALGIDMVTFLSSVMFGQGLLKGARRFPEMSDGDQKKILERILQIEWIPEAYSVARNKKKEEQKKLDEYSIKLEALSKSMADKEDNLEKLVSYKKEAEESLSARLRELDESKANLQREIASLEVKLVEIEEFDELELKQELLQLKNKKKSTLSTIRYKVKKAKEDVSSIHREVDKYYRYYVQAHEQAKSLSDSVVSGECPTCKRPFEITQEDIKRLAELQDDSDTFFTFYQSYDTEHKSKVLESEALADLLRNKEIEHDKLITTVENKLSSDEATKKQEIEKSLRTFKSLLADTEKSSLGAHETVSTYSRLIKQGEREISELASEHDSVKSDYLHCVMDKGIYEFWEKGFSTKGIRSALISGVISFLNSKISEYLSVISGDSITMELSSKKRLQSGESRDILDVRVSTSSGASSYQACSGGEKQRINLAILLALGDLISIRSRKKFNLLLLDEVFESIDEAGIDSVVRLLRHLSDQKESIFVITHNDELKSYFPKELTVLRENGRSTIL